MNNKTTQKTTQKQFFGQPLGLLNLFSTEFCERFSYYGMRAILVFYIYTTVAEGGLGLTKQDALYAMTIFGSSVYFLSVLGGWLADRVFGSFKAVFIGGVIITIGHVLLSIPFSGVPGTFGALFCIAVGTGLLKPNVSEMVGALYEEGDRRRQAGFNLFVMGINLGSLFSPIIVGYVADVASYHIAFSIPAVFMVIALFVYYGLSAKTLSSIPRKAPHPVNEEERLKIGIIFTIILLGVAVLVVVLLALNSLNLEAFSIVMPVVSIVTVAIMFGSILIDKEVEKKEKDRTKAYIAVFIAAVIFWAIEELQSSVFAVLADSRVDNYVGSFHVPEAWYQSINPFVIVILAPILAVVWTKFEKQPSTIIKICLGLFLTFVSFIIPAFGFAAHVDGSNVSPLLLIVPIILFSAGELFVSPIGLSSTTELAPKKYGSRLMAIWFLANTTGQGINAFCIRFFNEDNPSQFFFGYSIVTAVIIIALLVFLKPLKKLMHGIH